jgi:hypothetical protein
MPLAPGIFEELDRSPGVDGQFGVPDACGRRAANCLVPLKTASELDV